MNGKAFEEMLAERLRVCEQSMDEDVEAIQKVLSAEMALLLEDVPGTIEFLDHEVTPDQLVWISEIFDELVERSQSPELIDALQAAIRRFPDEAEEYHLQSALDFAQRFLR